MFDEIELPSSITELHACLSDMAVEGGQYCAKTEFGSLESAILPVDTEDGRELTYERPIHQLIYERSSELVDQQRQRTFTMCQKGGGGVGPFAATQSQGLGGRCATYLSTRHVGLVLLYDSQSKACGCE